MPRRAKRAKPKPETSSSSESDDDSFDEEDEVPLSQLIPQVKKDLLESSAAAAAAAAANNNNNINISNSATKKGKSKDSDKEEADTAEDDDDDDSPEESNETAQPEVKPKLEEPTMKSDNEEKDTKESEAKESPSDSEPTADKVTTEAAKTSAPPTKDAPKQPAETDQKPEEASASTDTKAPPTVKKEEEEEEEEEPKQDKTDVIEDKKEVEKPVEESKVPDPNPKVDETASKPPTAASAAPTTTTPVKIEEAAGKPTTSEAEKEVSQEDKTIAAKESPAAVSAPKEPAADASNKPMEAETNTETKQEESTPAVPTPPTPATPIKQEEPDKMDVDTPTQPATVAAPVIGSPVKAEVPATTDKQDSKTDDASPMEIDKGASPVKETPPVDQSKTIAATPPKQEPVSSSAKPIEVPATAASAKPVVVQATSPIKKDENAAVPVPMQLEVSRPTATVAVASVPATTPSVKSDSMEVDKPADTTSKPPQVQVTAKKAASPQIQKTPPRPAKPVYTRDQWAVEIESDEEEGQDAFRFFQKQESKSAPKPAAKKKKKKHAPKPIKITMSLKDEEAAEPTEASDEPPTLVVDSFADEETYLWIENDLDSNEKLDIAAIVEKQFQDSLDFFQGPHEDQDEDYCNAKKQRKREKLKEQLMKLDAEDKETEKQIGRIIDDQKEGKKSSTRRSVEKHLEKANLDERRELQHLKVKYTQKVNPISHSIRRKEAQLSQRHKEEQTKLANHWKQQQMQQRLPEHIAKANYHNAAQQLRQKQEDDIQKLKMINAKAADMKRKCDEEFQREADRIKAMYEKKKADIDQSGKKILAQILQGYTSLQKHYLKRNRHQMIKKKQELLDALRKLDSNNSESEATPMLTTNTTPAHEKKDEPKPPSPIQTGGDWHQDSGHETSAAALRHKHRKVALNQAAKQMACEIHNEGIWVYQVIDKNDNRKSRSGSDESKPPIDEKHFIPWGVKARDLLESLICGEIPEFCYAKGFDWGDSVANAGGHVRCVMIDLRTSDESAVQQRKLAVTERELEEVGQLQKDLKDSSVKGKELEFALAKLEKQEKEITPKVQMAIKDAEDKKRQYQEFRNKIAPYFGADGKPLPTTTPKQSETLISNDRRFKQAVEQSLQREKLGRDKLAEIKQFISEKSNEVAAAKRSITTIAMFLKKKKLALQEQANARTKVITDDASRVSTRVADIVSALKITADRRREQLSLKRSGSKKDLWIQNLPGLPNALRSSLYHKMHRRRQQIVLRPPINYYLPDLREKVEHRITEADAGKKTSKYDIDEEALEAERKLLVAMHPLEESFGTTPTAPPAATWAEPGWKLVLDVPSPEPKTILPRANISSVLRRNLSEIHSAPGRQAASLVRNTDLRCLAAPLSAAATTTSLAETASSSAQNHLKSTDQDPLQRNKELMALGYKFAVKAPPVKRPSVSRKPSGTAETPAAATKKAEPPQPKATPTPATKKRKSSTAGDAPPAKRAPRRKAPAKTTTPRAQQPKMPAQQPTPTQFTKPMQLPQQTPQAFFQQQQQQQQQQPPHPHPQLQQQQHQHHHQPQSQQQQQQQYQAQQQQVYQQQQQYQNPQASAAKQQQQVYQQQQQYQVQQQQQFQANQQQQPRYQQYQQFNGNQQQQYQSSQHQQQQQMQFQMMQQRQQQQQQQQQQMGGVPMPHMFNQQSFGQQQMQQPMQQMQHPQPDDQQFDPLFMLRK